MASNVENSIRVIWGLLLRVVAVTATVYFLYRVRSVLISLLIAILLTYVLLPFVDWICRGSKSRQCSKGQRLAATVIVFVVFLMLLGLTVKVILTPFTVEMKGFLASSQQYTDQVNDWIEAAGKWYKAVPDDLKGVIEKFDYASLTKSLTSYVQGALVLTQSWIGVAFELILIPVLAFYFVLDYRTLSREFYGLVPKRRRHDALRIGRDVGEILQSYVIGQIILCALAGILTWSFLTIIGMPYAVVLALFAAITRAIPIIGPVVSGIPIVLVGLLNSHGSYAVPIELLIFVTVMHFVESKFIMPALIGERLHLHPAVVIIVLLIGAEFFGLIGMFLAAPVAAIIRELIRLYYIVPRNQACRAAKKAQEKETPLAVV
ncbi:MAG: AI-2E family transporter [Armatimonadetes bacterium]|nr:AI-2E family transporter [Armatimonadota bacterium]